MWNISFGRWLLLLGFMGVFAGRSSASEVNGFIQIQHSAYTVKEGESEGVLVSLIRTGGTEGAVSVNFFTSDGSATNGLDYIGTNTVISFADGETQKEILIPILNDAFSESRFLCDPLDCISVLETNENFFVHIADPVGGASLGEQVSAVITIDDNDGEPNILWHHQDGRIAIWEMYGTNRVAKFLNGGQPVNTAWRLVGADDLNYDGHADLFWQHSDGRLAVWFMNQTNIVSKHQLTYNKPIDPAWKVVSVTDLNRDRKPDLLWRHVDGRVAHWYMDGTNRTSSIYLNEGQPVSRDWRLVGAANYNKKTHPTVFWQHKDGRLVTWEMLEATRRDVDLRNDLKPAGEGWLLRGFMSSYALWDLPDMLVFQNVHGTVLIKHWDNGMYKNLTKPIGVGLHWRLVGAYPRSN